jgi:hypothetical protein
MKIKTSLRTARALARPRAPSPLGALARGLLAGAAGAGLQSLFFRATRNWAPEPTPVRPEDSRPSLGETESGLEAMGRRLVEDLMQRGPLGEAEKRRVATAVHYFFGAAWGGLYGLWRESFRSPGTVFGAVVWLASDNLLLPAFRLAGWPNQYRLAEHRYALQAHLVYALGTAATYALLRDIGPVPLAALPAVVALQARAWALRTPPGRLVQRRQPWPKRFFNQFANKIALA